MCGICGIIHFDNTPVSVGAVQQMMQRLKHRGPDDEGYYLNQNVGLGHVRLSIIDLSSAGHQPMFSPDKRFCLVFNGEIYNYLELKQTLKEYYPFSTRTDSEVVLAAYLRWGWNCLEKFNGMFAFAIYDSLKKVLFIARDRFGIKPFYYYQDERSFIFASELQALLPCAEKQTPNSQAIYDYLLYNRTDQQNNLTFFNTIQKLPHGYCGVITNDSLFQKWYILDQSLKAPFKEPEEFYQTFKQSIQLQLRSDVPVGVCLSGGLDSSAIVSVLLKEFQADQLNTFSAIYEKEEPADESQYIHQYRDQLSNMFYVYPTAESLIADMRRFISCFSEPVATLGPYAQFKVMELASQHVKVTLDGQGADEQWGGYHYFFGSYFKQLLRQFRWLRLFHEIAAYTCQYKSLYAFQYLGLYLMPPGLKDSFSKLSHNYISDDFFQQGKKTSRLNQDLYNPHTLKESLIHHFEYKLEHLLKWEDHNSMAHSVESRVPFLDHNLVERTLSLPAQQIIHKATTKYMMRQALKDTLPEKIRTRRDKIGFATPWDKWFRTPAFQERILAVLHSQKFKERGYLNPEKCLKDYTRHVNGEIHIAKEIWKWFNLELWFQTYIDESRTT